MLSSSKLEPGRSVFYRHLTNHQPKTIAGRRHQLSGGSNPESQMACRKGPASFTATSLLRPCDSSKVTRESVASKGREATLEQ